MKLTPIVKGLALAGLLNSLAFAAWADTSAKEATEATKKANDALYEEVECLCTGIDDIVVS